MIHVPPWLGVHLSSPIESPPSHNCILAPRTSTMKYLALTLACILVVLDTPAHSTEKTQQTAPAVSAVITLNTDEGKRPAVFPHAKHQTKVECDACHKDTNFPTNKKWDMKKGHALCLGCHKAKNQGAVKCDGCHK